MPTITRARRTISNIAARLSDNSLDSALLILNNKPEMPQITRMKKALIISALILGLGATAASAECSVEFKAKRGTKYVHTTATVPVSDCSAASVRGYLGGQGYSNIQVVNITPGG